MKIFAILVIIGSLASIGLCQYPYPNSCTGDCGTHDPAVVRRSSDGLYFRFSTNGNVGTITAPSLSGPWTFRGSAFNRPPVMTQGTDYWAPDVTQVGDTYYMYYSVSSFGSQNSGIGVATSKTMEPGSWTDRGSIGLDSRAGSPYNAIDANLLSIGNNQYVMNLGSFWSDIYQAPMQSDLLRASGQANRQIIFEPAGGHAVEGVYMFREGNYYYAFFSAGQCCGLDQNTPPAGSEYHIKACRSSTYNGGFVDRSGRSCTQGGGDIVLKSFSNIYAPGGQGVLRDPNLGPVLYYHYKNRNIGLADGNTQFGWNLLDFSSGWPVVVSGTSRFKH